MTVLESTLHTLRHLQPIEVAGSVAAVRGLTVLVDDLALPVGSIVRIVGAQRGVAGDGAANMRGEVVGFDAERSVVMLLEHPAGVAPGAMVIGDQAAGTIAVGRSLLGRVLDGLGRPIDGHGEPVDTVPRPLLSDPTSAMRRRRIGDPLPTGVRAIDGLLTLGKGQRVGVFSAAGVGKSTLLGAIARNTTADVNVIALVGERGREVRDFIEHALGESGVARSVVIVATGDQSPLLRVRAAMAACAVAEHFRDAGADVMLMMDSITRFAQAQRQIGLSIGEQPATRGYTPSVFAMLPVLLERAGAIENGGSITGLYSVLVEGDDLNEPISDAARGVLDGHIVLSRRLAARGHYPAINALESISRVADDVCDANHVSARRQIIRLLAAYSEAEDLINIGAYASGSSALTDAAIAMKADLDAYLQQPRNEASPYPQTCRRLVELSLIAEKLLAHKPSARAPSPSARPSRRPA
jgi:flagellum-specific ATP synthase